MKIGVILAGGKSTRFKSDIPKGLHKIDGKSVISRILECFNNAGINKVYIVVNDQSFIYYKKENFNVDYLFQTNLNGTGSAFYCFNGLFDKNDEIIVVNSDCFIFNKELLNEFYKGFMLSFYDVGIIVREEKEKYGYGRVLVEDQMIKIIEDKELGSLYRNIELINTGIYMFKGSFLSKYMKFLNNNYEENKITCLLEKDRCYVYKCPSLVLCFNTKEEFVNVNRRYYLEVCNKLLNEGIKIVDKNSTYISEDVVVGKDVEIYPNNYILGNTIISDMSVVLPNCYIEDSVIGEGCSIGPFSNIKKNSRIGNKSVVGAFVEVKNSQLDTSVKAKHHAYLGDVIIGSNTNVGCGVIVANYDGNKKHQSYIGNNSFIGSNVTIVSPVKIGDNVVVGAGSTIVRDVIDNSLAIAREKQINKENYYKINKTVKNSRASSHQKKR